MAGPGLIDAELNVGVDAIAADLGYVSLHTASPGTDGSNEATGGTPAYARQALTWPSSSGASATASEVSFDVPAGTYTHCGFWTAVTGGTYLGGEQLSASETFAAQGVYKLTPTLTGSST